MVQQQFSADIADKASNVCLAHLFTYQDFDEGTLGLAYVAPSKPDIAGGLCSKGKILHTNMLPTCRFISVLLTGQQTCYLIMNLFTLDLLTHSRPVESCYRPAVKMTLMFLFSRMSFVF